MRVTDRAGSQEDILHHLRAFDSAETRIETLELEGERVVLDSELMQHRRVNVVDRGDLVHGSVSKVIGGSVDDTALDSGAGHPHGHRLVVMIATTAPL